MKPLEEMSKLELEAHAKREFGVDLHRGLSRKNLIKEIRAMEQGSEYSEDVVEEVEAGLVDNADESPTSFTALHKETMVQCAALLERRGIKVDGASVTKYCGATLEGLEASDKDAKAALDEAKKRSPKFDHDEILAKSTLRG